MSVQAAGFLAAAKTALGNEGEAPAASDPQPAEPPTHPQPPQQARCQPLYYEGVALKPPEGDGSKQPQQRRRLRGWLQADASWDVAGQLSLSVQYEPNINASMPRYSRKVQLLMAPHQAGGTDAAAGDAGGKGGDAALGPDPAGAGDGGNDGDASCRAKATTGSVFKVQETEDSAAMLPAGTYWAPWSGELAPNGFLQLDEGNDTILLRSVLLLDGIKLLHAYGFVIARCNRWLD